MFNLSINVPSLMVSKIHVLRIFIHRFYNRVGTTATSLPFWLILWLVVGSWRRHLCCYGVGPPTFRRFFCESRSGVGAFVTRLLALLFISGITGIITIVIFTIFVSVVSVCSRFTSSYSFRSYIIRLSQFLLFLQSSFIILEYTTFGYPFVPAAVNRLQYT
jgi:hypothetical protein